MAEPLIILIVGGLVIVGLVGLIHLVIGWVDNRNVDKLSEEWRRRARERREYDAQNDSAGEGRRNAN